MSMRQRVTCCTSISRSCGVFSDPATGLPAIAAIPSTALCRFRRWKLSAIDESLDLGRGGGAGEAVRSSAVDGLDHYTHTEHFLEALFKIAYERCPVGGQIRHLDHDRHFLAVLGAGPLHDAHVLTIGARIGDDDRADRFRENVDAPQLHHRVVAPEDAVETLQRTAAGALARDDARHVVNVEADLRRAPAVQGGDVHRAALAFR